eukprot:m.448610 g.448610  ORF g.448610 m.448610 type:complete len:968 (-) comp56892_c1_seq3:2431-5334(-)
MSRKKMGKDADEERTPLLSVNDHVDDSVALHSAAPAHAKTVKNQLGTLNGCFIPCCLNIMGAVMFMRLGWATGEAGIFAAIGMLGIGMFVTLLTAFSLSAIATNGDMGGGGSYYMISRSLGPEYGGAIGLCFYFTYTVSVAFFIVATGQEIQQTWFAGSQWDPYWTRVWVSSVCLMVCFLNSWAGARYFTRFNIIMFVIQMGAAAYGVLCFLIPHSYSSGTVIYGKDNSTIENKVAFPSHFVDNLLPSYTFGHYDEYHNDNSQSPCEGDCSFLVVFSIIFPMVTGIMEGANLSGDLKDPAKSLPAGTIWATVTAGLTYFFIILVQGAAFDRHLLVYDLNIFQNASYGSQYIIVIGILITSYSSGIGAMFGGCRILQAIARDDLFPILKIFGNGSKIGDEPREATVLTLLLSQAVIFMGSMDVIADIITAVFCLSYALINVTCFFLAVTGAPNFRPSFRFFNRWTALLGTVSNIVVMFYLSWMYGLIGTGLLLAVFIYLVFTAPARDWGEISQAIMFHQVRKYLLLLDTEKIHSKFWRPNILLVIDNPASSLIGFCNTLKKGGLLIVGHAIAGEFDENLHVIKTLRRSWNQFLKNYKVKGFSQVAVNPSYRHSVESLMLGSGLGGLSCNTVCLPLLSLDSGSDKKPDRHTYNNALSEFLQHDPATATSPYTQASFNNLPVSNFSEYTQLMHDAFKVEYNLMVACNFKEGFQRHKKSHFLSVPSNNQYTDIWIFGDIANEEDLSSTSHHLWGYGKSQFHAHSRHPNLIIPPPLEIEGGQDPNHANVQYGMEGLIALLVHLGAIADQTRIGADGKRMAKGHSFRILQVASSTCQALDCGPQRNARVDFIKQVCARARFDIAEENIKVFMLLNVMSEVPSYHEACSHNNFSPVPLQSLSQETLVDFANSMMKRHSGLEAAMIFTVLPYPHEPASESSSQAYVRRLNALTAGLPPTILAANGEDVPFIVTIL